MTYTPTKLTKADLTALRTADTVCFDFYIDNEKGRVSQIRANKNKSATEPWEQVHAIPVDHYFSLYNRDHYAEGEPMRCFSMIHSPAFNGRWETAVRLLRVGDEVRLHWIAGNDNEFMKGVPMSHDQLELQVLRENKSKRYILTFLVGDSITPPDSTARLVRDKTW